MNVLARYLKPKYLKPVFIVFALLYLYSLWGRIPDIDDGWIGELAYWLAEDGQVRSELMRGITQQEDKFVVSNKLFVLLGSLSIDVFGFSLYALKSVSLVFFVIFLFLFSTYTLKWKQIFNKQDLLLAFILLAVFPWTFKYSFLFRPEMLLMTVGFLAYIFLEKFLDGKKRKTGYLLLSGLLFGLAMSAHLNGLILASAAAVLLIWNKKYLAVIWLTLAALVGFLPYFFDMTSSTDFELWRHQFFDSPSLDSLQTGPFWLKPAINLLNEHMRYFHNLQIIAFSVFLMITLAAGARGMFKTYPTLSRFALLVALFTGLIAMHKSRQYILLNFPYMLILITLTFKKLNQGTLTDWPVNTEKRKAFFQKILLVLLLTFLVISTVFNVRYAIQKFSPEQNRILADTYAGEESQRMNVIAPMTFIFNEIENFNRIQGEVCYIEFQKADPTVKGEGFLKKADEYDIDLIMISPFYQQILGISAFKPGMNKGSYRVIDKTDDLLVLKRLH